MDTNRMREHGTHRLAVVVAALLAASLLACVPEQGPAPSTATAASGAATAAPSTATPEATASPTVQASPVPEATAAPAEPTVDTVKIFLVALEDGGQAGMEIGCGDSLVPVEFQITPTTDPLAAALAELLALRDRTYGESGLYNALYQSKLSVESIAHEDGSVTVRLTGDLVLGGVCDNPRFEAQIRETVLQFPDVHEVAVFINDVPLEEALSLKG